MGDVQVLRETTDGGDRRGEEIGLLDSCSHVALLVKYCHVALQYKSLRVIRKLFIRDSRDSQNE